MMLIVPTVRSFEGFIILKYNITKGPRDYSLAFHSLLQNLHCVSSTCPTDSPSAVNSASTEIQFVNWRLVIGPAWHRTHKQELVEHELTVVEVAFGETIGGFQIKWRDDLDIFD